MVATKDAVLDARNLTPNPFFRARAGTGNRIYMLVRRDLQGGGFHAGAG